MAPIPPLPIFMGVSLAAVFLCTAGVRFFLAWSRHGRFNEIQLDSGLGGYDGDPRLDLVKDGVRGLCAGLNAGGEWRDRSLDAYAEDVPRARIRDMLARLAETAGPVQVRNVHIVRPAPINLQAEVLAEERAAIGGAEMPEDQYVSDIHYLAAYPARPTGVLHAEQWRWRLSPVTCPACGGLTVMSVCEYCGVPVPTRPDWRVTEITAQQA